MHPYLALAFLSLLAVPAVADPGTDLHAEARAVALQGMAALESHDVATARSRLGEGAAKLEAAGDLELARLIAGHERAGVLLEMGDFDKADEELRRIAAGARALGGAFDAAVNERLGDLRRGQWRLDDARQIYTSLFDATQRLQSAAFDPTSLRAGIALKLAEVEMLSGRAPEAMAWNERASAMVGGSRGEPALQIRIVLQRATLFFDSGQVAAADSLYAEALRLADATGSRHQRAGVLIESGASRVYRGDYGKAIGLFHEALEILQQLHRAEEEAYLWSVVAMTYVLIESGESAQAALERGRTLAEQSTLETARMTIEATNLARRSMSAGGSPLDLMKAFAPVLASANLRGVLGPGDQKTLEGIARSGSDALLPLPLRGLSTQLAQAEGMLLVQQGRYQEGRDILLKGLETTRNHDLRAMYLGVVGGSHLMQRNIDLAIRYYMQAIDAYELAAAEVPGEEILADFLGGRKTDYQILIALLLNQGCPEEAFAYTERARSRAFLQTVGNRRINPRRERVAGEMETLRANIQEKDRRAPFASPREKRDLEQARHRYRELLVRVKASNPEYASLVAVEPLDVDDMRREIPEDTTLISYYTTKDRVHAWVMDRENLHYVRLQVREAVDLQRVACWATRLAWQSGPSRGMKAPGACDEESTAEDVFTTLIAPLLPKIRHRRIMIVPHGVLHYVPFAALRNPETGRYLIEDYAISYVPSISVLRFLRSKESPVDGGALVIGDPTGPVRGRALSGAQKEAIGIARRFRTRPKLGAAAKEALLYDLRGRFDLVHIGAHGGYDAENPLFSRIALARDQTHDGWLEVHEIFGEVDLTGVNLVVLSACGTGRGKPTGGDEIVGLTRAVHYAGSPGVIATLWDIDDDATSALMDELYSGLRAGASAADALRNAQLALLRSAPYRHPTFWGAFILSGDPRGRWMPQRSGD